MVFHRLSVAMVSGLLAFMVTGFAQAADDRMLRKMYDGAMFPDAAVATLSHTERLLPVRVVHRGGRARVLQRRAQAFPDIHFEDHGRRFDLYDYLSSNRVTGILVLKNGEIALEEYELGLAPKTQWASFSMAKSVTSTLLGAALVDGYIASLDDPVRHVLTMSSGVCWDETYTEPKSDRRRLLELQIAERAGSVLRYMNSLARCGQPGSIWNYNTGETYVLGAVIEGATHRPLADYLSEKIWSRAGMEQDATWWVESPDGNGWGGGGIGATLRDYGRFALIAADNGRVDGRAIVPMGWFSEAGAPHRIGDKVIDYGYMWWISPQTEPVHAGAFEAIGIFGQFMYINPREHLVIVVLSARSKPAETGRLELDDDAFFAAVATALH
jgi:CubicO group peptidase (beta-lactamase class C family)